VADISRIVRVTILLRTAGVRQQTFSDLLLLGVHTGPDRVAIITEADELLDAGTFNLANTHALYLAAQVAFSQNPGPRRIFIGRRGAAETVQTALSACAAENGEWYGFTDVAHASADVVPAATWAEANQRLFLTTLSASDTVTTATTDTATSLKTGNYFHTAWWYHPDAAQFPEVAIAASAFTTLPGGEVWANRTLAGVDVTALTETQFVNVKNKNGNTFETFRNYNLTQVGITAGGEWIDIIRFRDWLIEEVRTSVFNSFVNNRLPYTDQGIAVVRERIIMALELGIRRGGIAPQEVDETTNQIIRSYTVTVPRAADVSNSDKAARLLRDVKFTARLAGAITATEIEGILTYDSPGDA
jgi:hypothetical protein